MINTIQNSSDSKNLTLPSLPTDPTQLNSDKEVNKEPVVKKFSKNPTRKSNKRYLIAGILLLLLVIGGGISLYLMKINQDLRQQADTGAYSTGGDCSDASASQCQGKDPGDSCGGDGECRSLPNQIGNDGKAKCTCDAGSSDPTPTVAPTTEPTGEPTTEPTGEPTTEPTGEPTTEPTGEPTTEPTGEPTTEPTTGGSEPTTEPTAEPTQSNNNGGSSSSSYSESNSSATVNINTSTSTGTTSYTTQPDLPEQLPETGPEEWLKYLQIGLGALGAGALLLLFL
ncbi:MAG: hypothetical protein IT416_01720 [Candidatus Pacebacteria bacterium]|nr:hypothetical protein [Candidatus Paceibacterota bacterium]